MIRTSRGGGAAASGAVIASLARASREDLHRRCHAEALRTSREPTVVEGGDGVAGPVARVVQRVREVEEVYVQTAYTLGASKWQQIRTVFIPAVLSRVSDDVRVLVAISWTYIIVAELVNANSGGIGALAFKSARQSSIDKVFALLLVIIIIGFIQDKLFLLLDRILFPYKSNKG